MNALTKHGPLGLPNAVWLLGGIGMWYLMSKSKENYIFRENVKIMGLKNTGITFNNGVSVYEVFNYDPRTGGELEKMFESGELCVNKNNVNDIGRCDGKTYIRK